MGNVDKKTIDWGDTTYECSYCGKQHNEAISCPYRPKMKGIKVFYRGSEFTFSKFYEAESFLLRDDGVLLILDKNEPNGKYIACFASGAWIYYEISYESEMK